EEQPAAVVGHVRPPHATRCGVDDARGGPRRGDARAIEVENRLVDRLARAAARVASTSAAAATAAAGACRRDSAAHDHEAQSVGGQLWIVRGIESIGQQWEQRLALDLGPLAAALLI